MELRHLRYFVAVAETGSISGAAQKLFIAQPPLSAQIRQLEEEVGAPLLVRLPRGVSLTAAGESFLADARAILARSQDASLRARQAHSRKEQLLRVGLMPSTTQSLLPGLVKALAGSGLALSLEAREISPSTRQLQALRNAEIDLGFIRLGVEEVPPETCASIDDPYCLAIPRRHPLARAEGPLKLADAAHEPFVGFASHHQSDYFDQTLALCVEAGFRPEVRHVAGQFEGVLAMVACGLGVAIVPASCFPAQGPGRGVVRRRLTGSRYRSRLLMIARSQDSAASWRGELIALARGELQALAGRIRDAGH
jgi:DNA-binding transcriptional LysR family regulator